MKQSRPEQIVGYGWPLFLIKYLRVMKLATFFLLMGCLQVSATAYSQKTSITLSLHDVTPEQAFQAIKQESGYLFLYNNEKLARVEKKISFEVKNATIDKVMGLCLNGLPLSYKIMDKTIIIMPRPVMENIDHLEPAPLPPDKSIMGVVTDSATGHPLAGVTVKVSGKNIGTVTNAEGRFTLEVTDDAILEISYLGYVSKSIGVLGKTSFNIVLASASTGLNQLVVVGYGTQIQRDVTGSLTVIQSKNLEGLSVGSVSDALVGKASGVRISQTTGVPGAAPSIKIRGVGSITAGNDPLFVVDGFPMEGVNLSNFNMDDIESISILKDASAASIYGARAASGVILITTKKGREGPPQVSFGTYYGFQKLSKKVDVLSPEEYVEFATDAVNNAWAYLGHDPNDPMESRPSFYQIPPYFLDKSKWTYTDWQDEVYRTAPIMNSQLSVSGGSKSIKYRASGSFFDQNGIMKSTDFKRYNLNANITADLTRNLKINVDINASKVNENKIPDDGQWNQGMVGTTLGLPGFFATRNEDGSYPSFAGMGYNTSAVRNPTVFINEYSENKIQNRILGNASLEYNFMEGLQFKSHFGFNNFDMHDNSFQNSFVNDVPEEAGYSRGTVNAVGGFSLNSEFNWLWENTLDYKFKVSDIHDFDIIVGMTSQKDEAEVGSINATNFPDNSVPTLNAGQISSASTTRSEWSLLSYFSRIHYGLKSKYFVTLSIRADGSSRFGSQNRWGYFPSVSGAWVASDEDFLKNSPVISFLKVRAGYGLSGNNAIPNYGSVGLLSYSQYVLGNSILSGVIPSTLTNSNLGWEASKQLDAGIEMGLWNDRIKLTADIYQTISSDLLLDVPVPSILGVTSSLQNIGKVRNRGLEFSLTTRNINGKFNWVTDFNISFNRNEVLQLGPSGKPIISKSYQESNITQVGRPIGDFYGYIFEGVYNTQEEIDKHPHLDTDTPGDPIVKDVNHDGKISTDDRTVLGNYQPDFDYGMNNTFKYKGFDLSIFVQGVYGNEIMDLGKFQTGSMTGRTNSKAVARDRWRSPEDPGNGKVFKASIDVYGVRRNSSTFWMEDGSYLRIRNITLGYNFNSVLLNKIKINSARIYLSSLNPFTFTKYDGYNPEVSTYDSALTPGIDYFNYPLSKSLTFGINVTF